MCELEIRPEIDEGLQDLYVPNLDVQKNDQKKGGQLRNTRPVGKLKLSSMCWADGARDIQLARLRRRYRIASKQSPG